MVTSEQLGPVRDVLVQQMQDGERFVIRRSGTHIEVMVPEPGDRDRSPLRYTHPAIYGRLIAIQAQMKSAVWMTGLFVMLFCVGIVVAESTWIESLVPRDGLSMIRHPLTYVAFAVLLMMVLGGGAAWRSKHIWSRAEATVLADLDEASLTPAHCVALLGTDKLVGGVRLRLESFAAKPRSSMGYDPASRRQWEPPR